MTDDIETLRHTIYYVFGVERRNEAIAALERVAQSLDHYEREYLILQDRAESAEAERDALEATLRKAQEVLAELNTSIDNFWNDRRRPRLGNTCISSVNRVAVAQISSRAALAEIEKVLK